MKYRGFYIRGTKNKNKNGKWGGRKIGGKVKGSSTDEVIGLGILYTGSSIMNNSVIHGNSIKVSELLINGGFDVVTILASEAQKKGHQVTPKAR